VKRVSIFGCGWVGKALKKELEEKYVVNCSVRSKSPYPKSFYDVETIVIAIPPKGNYLQILREFLSAFSCNKQLILLSSTSVYSQTKGVVKEEDTQDITSPSLMLQAERLVLSICPNVVILRLGGLMGYDRIAGKYTAGKTKAHDAPVNYIHRDDVVAIIKLCIEQGVKEETFNVVAPSHPKQSEIYTKNAKIFGWENTYFESDEVIGKVVSAGKLVEFFGYEFLKREPLLCSFITYPYFVSSPL